MSDYGLKYIIWGAKGQAKVLADLLALRDTGIAAVVDRDERQDSPLANIPVLWGKQAFESWLRQKPGPFNGAIAIGGAGGRYRIEYLDYFQSLDIATPALIHPTADVAQSVSVGQGSQILRMSCIAVEAILGRGVIINTAASVDHECVLGAGVHIGPGAVLCGCVEIGIYSFVGAGSVVLPNINIGKNVIIGAGSVVTKDVPDGATAYGNPAMIQRSQETISC